jgi:hypothetical protein
VLTNKAFRVCSEIQGIGQIYSFPTFVSPLIAVSKFIEQLCFDLTGDEDESFERENYECFKRISNVIWYLSWYPPSLFVIFLGTEMQQAQLIQHWINCIINLTN